MKKIILALALLSLYSCANIQSLEGGDKDITPPKLKNITLADTHFNQKEIVLEFDEYIQLNDPDKTIKLYPEHSKLKCSVAKKKILIKLDTLLQANTTYFLHIDKGIKDVNEGNTFSYQKLFSTGSDIDTGKIILQIDNINEYKNLKAAILINQASDSLRNFDYLYTLNVNAGKIEFQGLKTNSNYYAWVYSDKDLNNKPDWYQPIAFTGRIKPDTSLKLHIHEWINKLNITRAVTDGSYIKIHYSKNKYYYLLLKQIINFKLDNLIYATEDSALLETFETNLRTDTIRSIDPYSELHGLISSSIRIIKGRETIIEYIEPYFYSAEEKNLKPKFVKRIYKNKPDSIFLYVPRIDEMDTLDISKYPLIESDQLSLLTIQLIDTSQKTDIYIKKDEKIIRVIHEINSAELFLDPGTYTVEIYESENEVKLNPFKQVDGPKKLYSKTLILKASWEENMQVKLE